MTNTMPPNALSGKRVAITGATGFVGANLVRRAVTRGADVSVIVRNNSDIWRIRDSLPDIAVVRADITRLENLREGLRSARPDILFHTAVYGGSPRQDDIGTIIRTNICGTVNLLRCCADISPEIFVNTGSSSEYGLKQDPMTEADLPAPINHYGAAKAAATVFCREFAVAENVPAVTLRLFSPFGPFEDKNRLVPSVILAALQERDPVISSRAFVRDFIFIDDVMDAYEKTAAIRHPEGQVLNIGSGKQHTVGEVADTIVALTGNRVHVKTGIPQAWKHEPSCWQADIRHAKAGLGWEPRHRLQDGLAATIDWFKANKTLYL